MNRYVAYYRTDKPLADQKAAFKRFVEFNEGVAVAEYVEKGQPSKPPRGGGRHLYWRSPVQRVGRW